MTGASDHGTGRSETGSPSTAPPARTAWEVAEVAAVAVLLVVLVLFAGGLAAGIAAARDTPDGTTAVQFGAQWASPVLAMVLLALVGLSWWQHEGWAGADPDELDEQDRAVHMRRARSIALWSQVGLVLMVASGVSNVSAIVVGQLGLPPGVGSLEVTRLCLAGASLLAVLVLTVTGIAVGRRLTPRAC